MARFLTANNPQIVGNVAEIQCAAADRRLSPPRIVEDIDVHLTRLDEFGRKKTKTDIDLVSDGTMWQIKVGRLPESIANEAKKLASWTCDAIAAARAQGRMEIKIGYRFDKESMKRYDSEDFQKLLADIKKENKDVIFLPPEEIPRPNVP